MKPTPPAAAVVGMLLEPGGLERVQLAWRLFRDQRVAPMIKLTVPALILLYVISPIDLIPDFLLGLGQLDDLGLIAIALAVTLRMLPRLAPPSVVAEHLADLRGAPVPPGAQPGPSQSAPGHIVDAEYNVR